MAPCAQVREAKSSPRRAPVGRERRGVLEVLPARSEPDSDMFITSFHPRCHQCDTDLDVRVDPFCQLCARMFCSSHLTVANGISTCHGCQDERKRRETEGVIGDAQFQRLVDLLRADLSATGLSCDRIVLEEASRVRLYSDDGDAFDDEVAGRVQQRVHDEFIDTTWPACPEHLNHPLWIADGWWTCIASGTAVARLGHLAPRP
jgi:hypothetical protein